MVQAKGLGGAVMVITFCGHGRVSEPEKVKEWLCEALDRFIHEEKLTFYLGDCGGFDRMAASVVREKKKLNPSAQSVLVIPYLNRQYDEKSYDYTLYPPLENVPFRFAISKRNKWMVSEADVVIAYVTHGWGGAAKTLEYARRSGKKVISY